MPRTGPTNLITDVAGLKVGNAEDRRALTGTTVIVPDAPCVAAADVRGGGPGTREIEVMDPANLVDRIDAVVLSGGSAFGLAAADGAMVRLAALGRGFEVGGMRVPIVPAAILFDLASGGAHDWGMNPPWRDLGIRAVDALATDFRLGNAGAGMGARAGGLKGGLGSASLVLDDGTTVGALVAANPVGSVVMGDNRTFYAWALERDGEFGGNPPPGPVPLDAMGPVRGAVPAAATTIAVVATDAALDKGQARRVAMMAHDGFARAIRPVHTPFDGDTIFALSTAKRRINGPVDLARIGAAAADCLARAIARAAWHAEDVAGLVSYRSFIARN
ncbi:MAG: P1 family peptidase [Pseudomonadota bacterium]|nr:P1 family peptidase [Pseudomonadota bacterium]